MATPTHAARLQWLYDEGAHIYPADLGMWLALGHAHLLTHPRQILWCATFPEHQGHVHRRRYTRATWHPAQQQMIFWRGDELVLTVQHHAHHRDPARADYIDGINKWKRTLATHNNEAQFAEFIAEA